MRSWTPELAAALADPTVETHLGLWLEARDVAAGVVRPLGFWTGGHQLSIDIDGATRSFDPVGDALSCEPLEPSLGIRSRRYRVSLTGQHEDLSTATRDLDLEMAPARLWRIVLDPASRLQPLPPIRLIKGWVDDVEARAGTPDEPGGVDLYLVTSAEALTWSLPDRRFNDATMRRRVPGTYADTPLDLTADGTTAIAAGTELLTIELVGGGGGGNSVDYYGNTIKGSGGTLTTVELLDGTAVVQTWQALGGAGGGSSQGRIGETTPLSPYGDGGDGQPAGWNPDYNWGDQKGGAAGQYLKVERVDITGLASPQVRVTVGAGGAGYQAGGTGRVIVHQLARTGPADGFFRHAAIASEVKRPW